MNNLNRTKNRKADKDTMILFQYIYKNLEYRILYIEYTYKNKVNMFFLYFRLTSTLYA